MIGAQLIVRVLQLLFYLAVAAGLLIAAYYIVLWLSRAVWDALGYTTQEHLLWLRSKLPKWPKRKRRRKPKPPVSE